MLDQPLAILREAACIERRLVELHVEEPAVQQVVLELLAELPIAADREERDEQLRFQQALRWDGRATHCGVHAVEDRAHRGQYVVGQDLQGTDGMACRNPITERADE